jgi:hypothetical protein
MNDKWTPNLGALDEQGASQLVSELLTDPDAERAHELRNEDYVMEMPQSGERIRGRQNMRAFQEAYPNPPAMRLRRLIVEATCGSWRESPTTAGRSTTR